ncbi:hypothetical protein Micbo1qcDRAFT_156824, partial [Microdochium bolleyi]
MVYTGKPSKSCEACRLRKKRCDKAVPGCGQCRRQGTTCPGYRDLLSLSFRNETARVIGKANAQRPSSGKHDPSDGVSPSPSPSYSSKSSSSMALVSVPPTSPV